MNKIKCSLCGKFIPSKESHNADPIKKDRCCNDCNAKKVIPCRIHLAMVPPSIKQQTYFTIGEKGNLIFDEETMITEFKEKLNNLIKTYEDK